MAPAARATRAPRARRLPRDPDPVRAERGVRLRRPRRPGARGPQRDPVPVRRSVARAGRRPGRRPRLLTAGGCQIRRQVSYEANSTRMYRFAELGWLQFETLCTEL